MKTNKTQVAGSIENLRSRVIGFFRATENEDGQSQYSFDFSNKKILNKIDYPTKNITSFLDFITSAVPGGEVYLFGGLLRDLALIGRRGFNSDIDMVIDGEWDQFEPYLQALGATKNKFGGYRMQIGKWPIDIWNARETWAIKQGLVEYKSIASLTETTVLNWDAILMNWRSKSFVLKDNYLEEINNRLLDIVLEENPNPLGMAVRVFRHLSMKDVHKISIKASEYLAHCTNKYRYEELLKAELKSYGNVKIKADLYKLFLYFDISDYEGVKSRFNSASNILEYEVKKNICYH